VPGKHGPVMICNVASLDLTSGPAEIDRYDRLRNVNFEIELNQQPLGEVEKSRRWPAQPEAPCRPASCRPTVGDAEAMAELFESFGLAMLTGVLCIYIVLVLLFKDFVQPVTILAALVLSVPGAFLALFVTADGAVDAVDDRPDHADGHRHQELDPADRLRRSWRSASTG
jgi:multidrug efflux pump subunit AcrB